MFCVVWCLVARGVAATLLTAGNYAWLWRSADLQWSWQNPSRFAQRWLGPSEMQGHREKAHQRTFRHSSPLRSMSQTFAQMWPDIRGRTLWRSLPHVEPMIIYDRVPNLLGWLLFGPIVSLAPFSVLIKSADAKKVEGLDAGLNQIKQDSLASVANAIDF